jgi:hypothetical protein
MESMYKMWRKVKKEDEQGQMARGQSTGNSLKLAAMTYVQLIIHITGLIDRIIWQCFHDLL